MAEPLPAHKRAEILVKVVAGIARRHDEIAAQISAEAGKPMKAAKVETSRAMSTYTFAAVEARKLAGEMVPMDAAQAGEGQARVHAPRADRHRRRDQPVQLPAQPRRPQDRSRAGGGLRSRSEAGEPDSAVGADACGARGRGRASRRLAERARRAGERDRRRARRGRTRACDHLHGLVRRRLEASRARGPQEGPARARKRDSGDRARRRRPRRGGGEARGERVLVRRSELHLRPADLHPEVGVRRFRRALRAEGRRARRRRPGRRGDRRRPGDRRRGSRAHPELDRGGDETQVRRSSPAAAPRATSSSRP